MTERIVIEANQVHLVNGDAGGTGVAVSTWTKRLARSTMRGLTKEPLADRTKWHVACSMIDIVILQLEPALRAIQWIAHDSPAPFGPAAKAQPRRVATPYVIVKVPFRNRRIQHRVEVFYRIEPLRSAEGAGGELFWPNLLNVSPHSHGCLSWFCTQFLESEGPLRGVSAGLDAVVHHLWGGQFNLSSEAHEGSSAFSKARDDKVDPRVTDIDRWEQESMADPRFVLSVPWRSTGVDVQKLVLGELATQGVEPFPSTVSALGNYVLRCQRSPSGGSDED